MARVGHTRYALAELVTAGEIARLLRVTPQAVSMWQHRPASGFPPAIGAIGNTSVWHRSQVLAWKAWRDAK